MPPSTKRRRRLRPSARRLARSIAVLALDKKAEDVRILDLRGLTDVTDYFVLCTGAVDLHIRAIANAVEDGIPERAWHREGYKSLQWVLLDYVDVVVHIFQPEARAFYGLERMWGDADVLPLTQEDPA